MKIKLGMQPARLLRCLALGLIPILINGCEVPQGAYRQAYGAEFSDWDNDRDSIEPSDPASEIVAPENEHGAENAPTADKPPGAPVENTGRPEPLPSKIPGISDIPEIPDEPTVLPE